MVGTVSFSAGAATSLLAARRECKTKASSSGCGEATDTDTLALLLQAGASCLALSCVVGYRLYRRFRVRTFTSDSSDSSADKNLAAARAELWDKERQLVALREELAVRRFSADERDEITGLRNKLRGAQEELLAAGIKCKAASERVARTACDLALTEAELRAHKAQLQSLKLRLEDTDGELNLTRSQNLLMERELMQLRRQLRDAAGQLESHLAARSARAAGLDELDY